MEDLPDALLFDHDLSPEARSALQDRLRENSDLAVAWAHWCAARRRLHDRLQEHLSDRRLLVLYVLEQEGEADALTTREQAALDGCRDDIARAIESLPALKQIVERIREEQADFETVWASHAGGEETEERHEGRPSGEQPSRQQSSVGRADRAPRPPSSQGSAPSRRWARRLAAAALLVGLAVVGVLLWPQEPSTTTVTVADGAVQVKTLGDGTTVRLVGPATATYPSAEAEQSVRRVTLGEGRAYFDVQPRDDAPFVVETPTATATVLGTQFGVATRADTTEVVLASGSVRVDDTDEEGNEGVVLEPGQRSWVAKGAAPVAPEPVDLTGALEWTGLFIFRSTPLDTIADRIGRRYDVQITVAEALKDQPVTGTFDRDQPVDEVLGALAATLGAEVGATEAGQYHLAPEK